MQISEIATILYSLSLCVFLSVLVIVLQHAKPPPEFHSYMINMSRNPERLVAFLAGYDTSDLRDIPLERVEGVDGMKLSDVTRYLAPGAQTSLLETERRGYRLQHFELTRGAVGCYFSHLNTLRKVVCQREPYAIVFEDDTRFRPDVLNQTRLAMRQLPKDWDMLLLGCTCLKCSLMKSGISKVRQFWQTHAYVITPAAAKKILARIDDAPLRMQIDSEWSAMARAGLLNVFCCSRNIATQNRGFATTIQAPIRARAGKDAFSLSDESNVA